MGIYVCIENRRSADKETPKIIKLGIGFSRKGYKMGKNLNQEKFGVLIKVDKSCSL